MKRQIEWTDLARDDLIAIAEYIAQENPDAADRVADHIIAAAARLADFATGRPGRITGTYEKVVAKYPYIIAYRIGTRDDGGEFIAIMHVIHSARDWPKGNWPKGND